MQVEHVNRHLEESEKVLQERIYKLEGQRMQLEEVRAAQGKHFLSCTNTLILLHEDQKA